MKPLMGVIGMLLRLVGISSPEDARTKPKTKADPPSWKDAASGEPKDPVQHDPAQ
jgi:hypothetical protein